MARFPLDIGDTVDESLLFWSTRFFLNKTTILSGRKVTDDALFQSCVDELSKSPVSFDALHDISNRLKKSGFGGVSVFAIPIITFAKHTIEKQIESLKEIDDEFVTHYLAVTTKKMSDATKINYKNAVLNFLNYISSHNEDSPGSGSGFIFHIVIKKFGGLTSKTKKMPEYLNKEEMDKFLEAVDNYPYRNDGSRLLFPLVIKLIHFTGARVSEIVGLNTKDVVVVSDGLVIKLNGKGNKERIVTIANRNIKKEYDLYNQHFASSCENKKFLCGLCDKKKELSSVQVSAMIRKVLKFGNISKSKSGAHLLRHSYATYVYGQTRDLRLVQELLGHADSKTTQMYTHIDQERIKKAMGIF
jgi:integrase/recombinase XerD